MKTIVSILLAACLVSCSQPAPQPKATAKYAPIDLNAEATTAPRPVATIPAAPAAPVAPAAPAIPAAVVVDNSAAASMTPPSGIDPAGAQAVPPLPLPVPRPAVPTVPTFPPVAATARGSAPATTDESLVPEMSINFRAAPIDLVLQTYADYVHKTLLRAPNSPGTSTITLVQQNPLTKKEVIQALDAVLAMNNIAMVPIGDKFVKVVLLTEAGGSGGPINEMNSSMLPEFGPFDTHIVQLKYTKPSEIQPILQQFTKNPTAILPIEGSGMLVLRDTAENVRAMLDMINRLDISVPSEIESDVIPIKYALATDIANALNTLSGGGGGTSTFGGSGSAGRTGSLGTSRSVGAGNARGGVGGLSGGYNAGGVNPQGSVSSGGSMGGASTLGAGGAASPSFTDRVRSLIARADGGGGKGDFQILGQTKIIADERMNALLVFAGHEDMLRVKDVVKKLDVVLAQVLIEAIIMEVTLDNTKSIGVSASQSPQGNNNVFLGGYNNGQSFYPFNGNGSSNAFPGNFTSALPGNMFSYWGKFGNTFDVAVQAAENNSRVNVLSRPRIQTSHGVEADLFVGSTIPYVDGTTAGAYGGTGVYNSYQQQQVGVTLKVKPLINPDGLVVMDIFQEASVQGPAGTAVSINGTSVPTINQRQASATVAVKDRDTIILGGMISTSQSRTRSGVPYLKDIPLLGNLFRSSSSTGERVELIVLIRPTVLPTPEAAAAVATEERHNLPGVRRAEAEIREDEATRLKAADEELQNVGSHTNITNLRMKQN